MCIPDVGGLKDRGRFLILKPGVVGSHHPLAFAYFTVALGFSALLLGFSLTYVLYISLPRVSFFFEEEVV